MYNYIICFPLKLIISFWRTAMSWLHNHAPISCNITPPPRWGPRRRRWPQAGCIYDDPATSNTHSSTNLQQGQVNLVRGRGPRWGRPDVRGRRQHTVQRVKNIACRIDQGHWMVFCANGSPNGLAIMCIIWTALHALSSAAMKGWTCTARRHSTSRTPWPGRWQNPATAATQLLGEAIQIADGGKLPRV